MRVKELAVPFPMTCEISIKRGKSLKKRLSYCLRADLYAYTPVQGLNRFSRDGLHEPLKGIFRRLNNARRIYAK